MEFKEGDRVKYTGKEDPNYSLKNGMKGTIKGIRAGLGWTQIIVEFGKKNKERLVMSKNEIKPVKTKKNKTIKLRKVKLHDRVLVGDANTGERFVVVIDKLKYSYLDNTITISGYAEDDSDVTYSFESDAEDKVVLA